MTATSLAKILRQRQLQQASLLLFRRSATTHCCKSKIVSQRLSFHSSIPASLPPRRRRRGSSSGSSRDASEGSANSNPLAHVAVTDTTRFLAASETLLSKIENALHPMKEKNEIFIIEKQREEHGDCLSIDLGPKDGTYKIQVREADSAIQFSSPISGMNVYVLSAATSEWVGIEDGHSFEGLLVRDLIRQCQGLPDL